MDEPRGYPAGVPCWVDIEVPDLAAATRFYGGLFGWEFGTDTPPGSAGRYLVARLGGDDVAGVAVAAAGGQPSWSTYVKVDSADEAAARVAAAGGTVVEGPHDVPGAARVAVCADPAGASFRIWEERGHAGAARVNEPGTWNMSELNTDRITEAETFYGSVFGWQADPVDFGAEVAVMWRLPGYGDYLARFDPHIRDRQEEDGVPPGFEDAVGWMSQIDTSAPGSPAPNWSITFAVSDVDGTAARTTDGGGAVLVEPFDASDQVRLAVLQDPFGAALTVNRYGPAVG